MSTQVKERVFKASPASRLARRPFGLSAPEIAGAIIVLLLFVFIVVYYFLSLSPEQDKLNRLEDQNRVQEIEIGKNSPKGPVTEAPPVDEGKAASDSLREFKEQHLLSRRESESRLRDLINKLAVKHGLQLVGGIPMNESRADQATGEGDSKRKLEQQALEKFPSLETEFAVAGEYSRLRAFVADLESSSLFTLIKSISLTTQEESGEEGPKPKAVAGGIQLTIKLSLPFEDQ